MSQVALHGYIDLQSARSQFFHCPDFCQDYNKRRTFHLRTTEEAVGDMIIARPKVSPIKKEHTGDRKKERKGPNR